MRKVPSCFLVFTSGIGKVQHCRSASSLPAHTKPVSRRPYKANPRTEAAINKCVQDMLNDGIIEDRSSPWGSPVTIVAHKDGQPRFCVDYRSKYNKQKPHPQDLVDG